MPEHLTEQIRNVVLIGHGGVGKTTLAEALLHHAGITTRAGSVDDGTSSLDRDPEEVQRGSSVSLAVASFDWKASDGESYRINLLDTPGHPDFEAEVDAALAVADLAVLVVSAPDGLEVGSHEAWRKCAELDLPRMVFVTREGKHRANFEGVVAQLSDTFGPGFLPIELPLGEEGAFHGVADVLAEEAHEYEPDGSHHVEPLPADDLVGHAMVQESIRTPVCLDESVTTPEQAEQAIDLGACRMMNLKPDRLGGLPDRSCRERDREAHARCKRHRRPGSCSPVVVAQGRDRDGYRKQVEQIEVRALLIVSRVGRHDAGKSGVAARQAGLEPGVARRLDGHERSDVLGPWLASERVRKRMEAYELA